MDQFSFIIVLNSSSLKVARLDMNLKEIAKNIYSAIYDVIPLILKSNAKHTSVAKISIRSLKSISIPFYPEETDDKISS